MVSLLEAVSMGDISPAVQDVIGQVPLQRLVEIEVLEDVFDLGQNELSRGGDWHDDGRKGAGCGCDVVHKASQR